MPLIDWFFVLVSNCFSVAGKGKITDYLSQDATLCCRSAGGHSKSRSNVNQYSTTRCLTNSFIDAGHTIVHDSVTYDFHILPSGLVSPKCINLIGAGTVVHIPSFFKELGALADKGLVDVNKRVFISDRAHVCFDLHSVVDGLEEAKLGGRKVGTTGKGIGPCYSDKAARRGVRVGEILDEEVFERKLRNLDSGYRNRFGDLEYDVEDEINRFKVCLSSHFALKVEPI